MQQVRLEPWRRPVKLIDIVNELGHHIAREIGTPASMLAVLRILAITDGGAGIMDLAWGLGINAAAVTRQVQNLERDRLVQRRSDPNDGRWTRLSLGGGSSRRSTNGATCSNVAAAAAVLAKLCAFVEGLG